MEPDDVRRLNRSSPSRLNSSAQRTDFFHGLLAARGRDFVAQVVVVITDRGGCVSSADRVGEPACAAHLSRRSRDP